jgi:ABC-2 type transport system ATP-binding protein
VTTGNSVEVKNLIIQFGDFKAVNDITFSVRAGEIFGFLGANGAGKTTTIRSLCGLLVPTSGDLRVAGLSFADGVEAIKQKVGYMSQKFTLYNDMTVAENLEFTAALRKIPPDVFRKRVDELLNLIGFKQSTATLVRDLPGGLKQQLALANSILHDPEIIFLDEPTAGVAPAVRARFWNLIRSLSKQSKTIFVTTHYMDEAEHCDRLALMRAGEIIALDTPAALKQSTFPEPIYELDAGQSDLSQVLKELSQDPTLDSLEAYGIRYHVSFKSPEGEQRLRGRLPAGATLERTQPSLEDVFIRRVEGKNR